MTTEAPLATRIHENGEFAAWRYSHNGMYSVAHVPLEVEEAIRDAAEEMMRLLFAALRRPDEAAREATIERMAKAMAAAGARTSRWGALREDARDEFRRYARAAYEAIEAPQ